MAVEQGISIEKNEIFSRRYIAKKILKIGAILAVLYLISIKDYLLFHAIIEFIVAAVAVSIFLLAWNSRKFSGSGFYVFIGSAFLASGMITILHALAYKGMGVIPEAEKNSNLATQLWLANQYLLAVSFVAAPFFINRKPKVLAKLFFFAAYSFLIILSIFWWKNFPIAYIEGQGLTAFKTYSEYFVALLFLLSAYLFFRKRGQFDSKVVHLFYLVSILFAASTILFTLYVGVYSSFNLWGHLIRLAAMYPVYIGVIEFGLMKPYDFLFGNLKKREEDLEKNEKMFRAVVHDQTELLCRFLPDGTLTFVNDAYCRYYGKSQETLIGRPYFGNVPEDVAEKDKIHLKELNHSNPVGQYEHRAVDKNGWHRWQHWTTRAIFDGKKDLVEFQSVGRDITQQKYIQEALVKSEKKYRSLVDNSLVGIYRLDKDGNYSYVNEAMAKMFEFDSPEEMIRENVRSRYNNPKERRLFLNLIKEKGKLTNYEAEGMTKRGHKIVVLASVTLDKEGISGIVVDVTQKREAEEEVKRAKEEWEKTFDSVPDLIAILDPNHKIIRANRAMADRLGTKSEKCVGLNCYECVHKTDKPIANCPHSLTLADGKEHIAEVEEPALGGTFLVSTTPFFGKDGKLAGSVHVARDITERKKAEEKMESLAKFPEENPNTVMRVDQSGKITYANPASRSLLRHWKTKLGGKVPGKWLEEIQHALKNDRKNESIEEYNGKIFSIITAPVLKGRYANLYGLNITEIKKLEKAKDEFISLASHQLRTPLSSIALSAELLLRGVGGDVAEGQKEYLGEIYKATKRMTLLVSNLLNVSRVEMGNFEVRSGIFDISSAVRESVKSFAPLVADKKLKVSSSIGESIEPVSLDANSFGIIFENIFSNAIRYTPEGGEISISLSKEKNGVLLKVADSGCGIPAIEKENIFRKSFRARNAKEISTTGAGIGLYMSKIAAEKSGVKIWFESEEGKGTTFFVLFKR